MREFVILMASLMSIVAISIDAMLPALGIIGAELKVADANHAQYVISFLFLGMMLGQIFCGPLSDAIGRKKILFIGLGIYMIGAFICYMAPSLELLLLGRVVQGIGAAGPYVSTVAIVRDKFSGRDMARVMSLVMMIFILVPAIAPAIGQAVMHFVSWRGIFVLYICYAVILLTWLKFRLKETLRPENAIPFNFRNFAHGFREITGNRMTVCYTICMGICFGSLIGYLNSSQQIFQVQFGTGNMFALYFGILALLIGVASFVNSHFVQRLGMRYICKRGMLAIVIASVLFLAVNYMVPVTLWMFMAYAAVIFFSFGLMFGNLNAIAMAPMGHIAGIASALIGASSSVISMVLGTIIGQLYNNTLIPLTTGFLVLGLISLGCMIIAEGRKFISE
jgi:DHA1 family bicyclomycin/chloramphenicol resistance-like MFS transporter